MHAQICLRCRDAGLPGGALRTARRSLPSGTPRSAILRNSTAIQRVLPMSARRAHKSECGERRRITSQDGGLRRGVARGTCRSQRQQPLRVSRRRTPANRALGSAGASRQISRRGTRSQRRHGPQIGLRRSGAPLARLEPRLAQPTRALDAGARDVSARIGGGRNRRTARSGARVGAVLRGMRRQILVPTCGESLSPDFAANSS